MACTAARCEPGCPMYGGRHRLPVRDAIAPGAALVAASGALEMAEREPIGALRPRGPARSFYIASSRDGLTDVRALANTLAARGMRNAFDWPAHFEHRCAHETCGIGDRAELARRELIAAGSADLFVGIARMGKGTHVELGAALYARLCGAGAGRTILVGVDRSESVFYVARGVEHATDMDELDAMLAPSAVAGCPRNECQIRGTCTRPQVCLRTESHAAETVILRGAPERGMPPWPVGQDVSGERRMPVVVADQEAEDVVDFSEAARLSVHLLDCRCARCALRGVAALEPGVAASARPLCTRCGAEPSVQGSELGERCLWPAPSGPPVYIGTGTEEDPVRLAGESRSPGWPCCPRCGQDALWGERSAPSGCRRCGWSAGDPVPPRWESSPLGREDAGAAGRPEPPCSARVGSSWCALEQRHEGPCAPVTSDRALPVADFGPGRGR